MRHSHVDTQFHRLMVLTKGKQMVNPQKSIKKHWATPLGRTLCIQNYYLQYNWWYVSMSIIKQKEGPISKALFVLVPLHPTHRCLYLNKVLELYKAWIACSLYGYLVALCLVIYLPSLTTFSLTCVRTATCTDSLSFFWGGCQEKLTATLYDPLLFSIWMVMNTYSCPSICHTSKGKGLAPRENIII